MRAGQLNKRVTIQQKAEGKGASGGRTVTWSDWAAVWAAVRPMSGTERRATAEGGQVAEARTEIWIRYRAGVTEEMRVSYAGKIYNIRHVKDVSEAHEWLLLTCDTGVNDG